MPEPPQLTPFDMEEELYSKLPLDVWKFSERLYRLKADTYSARTDKCVRFLEVAITRTKFVLARTFHTARETQVQNSWEVLKGPAHSSTRHIPRRRKAH